LQLVLRRPEQLSGKLTLGSSTGGNPTLVIAAGVGTALGGSLRVGSIEVRGGSIQVLAGGDLTVTQNITINLGSATTTQLVVASGFMINGWITVARGKRHFFKRL
jgi:hypothetical protein